MCIRILKEIKIGENLAKVKLHKFKYIVSLASKTKSSRVQLRGFENTIAIVDLKTFEVAMCQSAASHFALEISTNALRRIKQALGLVKEISEIEISSSLDNTKLVLKIGNVFIATRFIPGFSFEKEHQVIKALKGSRHAI